MNFADAAAMQHRRNSYYAVFLCGPNGEREEIAISQRKSGGGLLAVLYRPRVQERIKQLPGAEGARVTKHKDRLDFSNGWRLEFGGLRRGAGGGRLHGRAAAAVLREAVAVEHGVPRLAGRSEGRFHGLQERTAVRVTKRVTAMKPILANGMAWEEIPISHGGKKKWSSENSHYEIYLTRDGKYRLVAFEHEPSTQFPQAEFWMREYPTLEAAAHQAETM